MKNVLFAVATASALVLAGINGCSSSSSGANTTGSCNGRTPTSTADKACDDCMAASCNGEISACYGSGYRSGSFGGPCGPVITCSCSCAENDLNCLVGCGSKGGETCQTCQNTINACEESKCKAACGGSTTTDSGTNNDSASAGGCGNLIEMCCPQISDVEVKSGCQEVAASGNDSTCDSAYSGYKAAGMCP